MHARDTHLHVVLVLLAGVRGVHVHELASEHVLELHDLAVPHALAMLPRLLRQVVLVLRIRRHLEHVTTAQSGSPSLN